MKLVSYHRVVERNFENSNFLKVSQLGTHSQLQRWSSQHASSWRAVTGFCWGACDTTASTNSAQPGKRPAAAAAPTRRQGDERGRRAMVSRPPPSPRKIRRPASHLGSLSSPVRQDGPPRVCGAGQGARRLLGSCGGDETRHDDDELGRAPARRTRSPAHACAHERRTASTSSADEHGIAAHAKTNKR